MITKLQIRNPRVLIGLLSFILLAAWWRPITPAAGQESQITWREPTNVSNTATASAHPAIIADSFGYVHLFWSEEMDGRPMNPGEHIRNTGNTILYSRWDGVTWSPPIDILTVPGETMAEWPAVAIDPNNKLHLVWIALSHVYYSNALSRQAGSARAWSSPFQLASSTEAEPWAADIAVDTYGGLHVVYASGGDMPGIYYIRSVDDGLNWSSPIKLSDWPERWEHHYSTVKISTDDKGYLHAVWGTNQFGGTGQAIYYARSLDQGDSWDAPMQLAYHDPDDFVTGTPYLTAARGSELHLIYVDGPVIGSRGRYHRISQDSGETWSEPNHIITNLVGINGYVVPVVDGTGQMHLIINMRTFDTQIVGIYYARWRGTGWSPVEPIDTSVPSAHYTAATIRLGNEIHVVYTQIEGGEIWHISGVIPSARQQPALELPPPEMPTPLPTVTEVATQTPAPTSAPRQPLAVPVNRTTPIASSSLAENPLVPVVGAPLLLVAGVIGWTLIRRRLT